MVDEGLIAEVLAQATGIPVFKLTEEESSRLVFMEKALHQRVIGQEEAIAALSKTIRRQRAGLKDPKRPSGSFIFAGPTGVGKTELAKALAEFLFDDEAALISLDMSEFGEKHTVSRLFGAPPGFVGFEEGGQLTEKVRRKPFSVVLFDEIEKAHPDIFNSLLQILEEGRLTDGQGRVVDFKNTVIIMTTNLGAPRHRRWPRRLPGRGRHRDRVRPDARQGAARSSSSTSSPSSSTASTTSSSSRSCRKPELLQIVDLFIKRLAERLLDRDMTIELSQPAKERLIEIGFDPALGARPLRRAMQHEVEDRLSEKILHGELNSGDHVKVDSADGEFVFENGPRGEKVAVGRRLGGGDHGDSRPGASTATDPVQRRRADAAASAFVSVGEQHRCARRRVRSRNPTTGFDTCPESRKLHLATSGADDWSGMSAGFDEVARGGVVSKDPEHLGIRRRRSAVEIDTSQYAEGRCIGDPVIALAQSCRRPHPSVTPSQQCKQWWLERVVTLTVSGYPSRVYDGIDDHRQYRHGDGPTPPIPARRD